MRQYEDDCQEAKSLMLWLDRRAEHTLSIKELNYNIQKFNEMWLESFGVLDNIPTGFKIMIQKVVDELKTKNREIN